MTANPSTPDAIASGDVVEVDHTPNLGALLVRSAVSAMLPSGADLPTTTMVQRGVTIDPRHVAAYAKLCGFRLDDRLPPTYLHLLAFPLSVELMSAPRFPFALPGLVHVRNRILHHRPVTIDETVDLTVRVRDLRRHQKGQVFDVEMQVGADGDTVWTGISTYFHRGGGDPEATATRAPVAVDADDLPLTSVWRVPADTGRRYGAVSGDRNPIHVAAPTARLFGFRRAIAHGMWTKARSLAALDGRLPDAYDVDVAFKLPLFLPGTVEYATARVGEAWHVAVRSRDGRPHLTGAVTPR